MELNNTHIIHDDDPRIRQRSKTVPIPLIDEDRELLEAMYRYVKDSQDPELCESRNLSPAVGIAAIQVAVPKKMIAIVVPGDEESEDLELALANPRIISRSIDKAYLKDGEGCLSVPQGHPGCVCRAQKVKVQGYDLLTDQPVTVELDGYAAMVAQHEIDHLSGILYYDHINARDPWKPVTGAFCIE